MKISKRGLNKKAIAMPFNWIFAIFAGGAILILAIYGASKFVQTSEQRLYTETAAKLVVLLDPLETGLASGKSAVIKFRKETKTFYDCDYLSSLPFGRERISFSEKTFGEKFGEAGGKITIKNKYIFAENTVEGKELYVFSMPFFMPFKVADLIMITSGDYCFYEAPNKVEDDIEGLNLNNIKFDDNLNNCTGVIVCFGSSNPKCNITIESNGDYESGKIFKDGDEIDYTDNLLYAGIFSSPEIYECNVKRLANKFKELSLVYIDKIKIIKRKGCSSTIDAHLMRMREDIDEGFNLGRFSSSDLLMLSEKADNIDKINNGAKEGCMLY